MNDTVKPGSVLLHPTKGLNPRDAVCPRCGQKHGKVMLGMREYAGICQDCNVFNIGLRKGATECDTCGSENIEVKRIPEKMPLPQLCQTCEAEIAMQESILTAGGVLWQCEDCGNTGSVAAGHPLAIETRRQTMKPAPEPCGALLDKTTCPVCQGVACKKEEMN